MPKRIQRKRTKGWRTPEGAVYVGRRTKWGNPYIVGRPIGDVSVFMLQDAGLLSKAREDHKQLLTGEDSVHMYRIYIEGCIKHNGDYYTIENLRGKDLMCWCRLDMPCHADVLLELANN